MSKRAMMAVAVTFVLTTVMLANVIGQKEETPEEPNIIGVVLDQVTNKPISAQITIHGTIEQSFMYTLETDDRGHFQGFFPTGTLYIQVESRGYETQRKEIQLGEREPLELKFLMKEATDKPQPNVFGHMLSEDGQTVPGLVHFLKEGKDDMVMETERDGTFQIYLEPGTYKWIAESKGFNKVDGTLDVPREGETRLMITLKTSAPDEVPHGVVAGKVLNLKDEPIMARLVFMPLEPREGPNEAGEMRMMEPFFTESGKDGSFIIRLPLGMYMMEVNAEHYHPFILDLPLSPDDPEVKVMVRMDWMEDERFPEHNIKVLFEYTDENSDGNPEKMTLYVDINEDKEHDIVFEMMDRNSDGNPESTKFIMDIPMERFMDIINQVLDQLSYMPNVPFPEKPPMDVDWEDQDDKELPPWDQDPDEPMDDDAMERLKELFGMGEKEDVDKVVEESETSNKEAKKEDSSNIFEILMAVGALMVLVSILVIGIYVIRLKKFDN